MLRARDLDLQSALAELLQWSVDSTNGVTVVTLFGEVDLSTAPMLAGLLDDLVADRPSKLVVDLARVSFLDSTGIHSLLSASKLAASVDCTLVARNPNPSIERIFTICGVDELLLEPSEDLERSDGAARPGR